MPCFYIPRFIPEELLDAFFLFLVICSILYAVRVLDVVDTQLQLRRGTRGPCKAWQRSLMSDSVSYSS